MAWKIPLQSNPRMAELIGCIIGQNTAMEETLRSIFEWASGISQRHSRLVFGAVGARGQRQLVQDSLALVLNADEFDEWAKFLSKRVKNAADKRHLVAHHLYAADIKPDRLTLINPSLRPGSVQWRVIGAPQLERDLCYLEAVNEQLTHRYLTLLKRPPPVVRHE